MPDTKCNGSVGTGYFAHRCQSQGTTLVCELLYCFGCALIMKRRVEAKHAAVVALLSDAGLS